MTSRTLIVVAALIAGGTAGCSVSPKRSPLSERDSTIENLRETHEFFTDYPFSSRSDEEPD